MAKGVRHACSRTEFAVRYFDQDGSGHRAAPSHGEYATLVFCCMFVIHSRAETVALWKLDYEAGDSVLNARCLLNPAHDLLPSGSLCAPEGASHD